MKNLFSLLFTVVLVLTVNAQIKFSTENDATLSSGSVLLEFDNSVNNSRGLILPMVNSLRTDLPDGTMLFYGVDYSFKAKVDGSWVAMNDIKVVTRLDHEFLEMRDSEGGIVIGDESDTAKGALVLASTTKAMVLPKIEAPHLKVVNPYEGMICYDTQSNMMAMFDGVEWNYWE